MSIKSVCVYCASSSKISSVYFDATDQLGLLLAKNNINCICGAGNKGLMNSLTDSVIRNGGHVTGIIPQFMVDEGWHHQKLSEIIVTETMHERKSLMAEKSDAVIALPGGCGTLEELLEIITWRQLGLYNKPIVILNVNGYYDDLIRMLEKAISESFMREEHKKMWQVASNALEAVELLQNNRNEFHNDRKRAAI